MSLTSVGLARQGNIIAAVGQIPSGLDKLLKSADNPPVCRITHGLTLVQHRTHEDCTLFTTTKFNVIAALTILQELHRLLGQLPAPDQRLLPYFLTAVFDAVMNGGRPITTENGAIEAWVREDYLSTKCWTEKVVTQDSCRRPEVFIDVVERLTYRTCVSDRNRIPEVVEAQVVGEIRMSAPGGSQLQTNLRWSSRCDITPRMMMLDELFVPFNDDYLIIPPKYEKQLARYLYDTLPAGYVPFQIVPRLVLAGTEVTIEVDLVSKVGTKCAVANVELRIPLPEATAKVRCGKGKGFRHERELGLGIWSVAKPEVNQRLELHLGLYLPCEAYNEEWQLRFQIGGMSLLQLDYVKTSERAWIKYQTEAAWFTTRVSAHMKY